MLHKIDMAGTSSTNHKNSAPYDDCEMMKPYEFFFNRFPRGFMFQPSDEELVLQYLTNKLSNKPLPTNKILDLKIYNFTPMQLADMHKFREEEAMYFFSPRDRKYPNGNRPNRITGDGKRTGFWKATGKDIQIFNERNKAIGARKALVFYERNSNYEAEKTDWIMHEFKIHEDIIAPEATARAPGDNRLDDWVLCKVYLSKMAKPNPNTRDEAEKTVMINSKPLEQDLPLLESSAPPNLVEQFNMNNQRVQPFNNGIMTVPYDSTTGFVSQEVTNIGPRSHVDHPQNLSSLPSSSEQQVIDSVSSAISSLAGEDNNNGMITTPYGYADGLNGSEEVINFSKNLHADHLHNSLMPSVINSFDSAIASLAAGPVLPRGFGAQYGTNRAPTNGIPAYQSYQPPHSFGAHVTNLGPKSHVDHPENLSLLPSSSQQPVIDSISSAIYSLAGEDNNNGMITKPYGYADGLNGSEEVITFSKNLHADHQHSSLMPSVINSFDSAIASLAAGPVLPHGFGAKYGTNIAPTNGIPAYQSHQPPHSFGAHPSLPSCENGCLPPLPQGYYSYDDLGYGSF